MAQDQENANTGEAGAFLAEPPAAAQDGLATGIDNLQSNALDGSEVSRQLEDLTGVVLSSAEVSTRSAEVAANISEEMRNVMLRVDDMGKRNVLHSRVMLIGLLSFLLIAVGTFFAISTRLQQNIRQLDALSLAVGKRVVELDATISAFGDATNGLGDTAEKLTGMEERQVKLDGKFETKMEDLNKLFNKMPEQIAGQVNGQSEKSLDAKLQNLQKSIQAVEAKMQALSAKATAPAPVQNNQAVITEIQKLKKDLETALAANQVATKAAYEREKAAEKAAVAAARNPPLSMAPAPEVKTSQTKAAELKAAQAKLAEARAAEAKAQAKAAAEAKAAEDAKAAEAKAKADAKAAEARAKAIETKAAAERAAAAAQAPAIPPRAQPKEDRVVFPRANTDNSAVACSLGASSWKCWALAKGQNSLNGAGSSPLSSCNKHPCARLGYKSCSEQVWCALRRRMMCFACSCCGVCKPAACSNSRNDSKVWW
jgi:septal ring factor EnvC (AmiA/AmiB activator)